MFWYSPMNPEDLRWQLPANSECTKNPDGYRMRSCFTIFAAKRKDHGSLWSPSYISGDSSCPYAEPFRKEWVWEHEHAVCWTTHPYLPEWGKRMTPRCFPWLISLLCASRIPLARDTFSGHLAPPYLSAFKRFCLLKQSTGNASH